MVVGGVPVVHIVWVHGPSEWTRSILGNKRKYNVSVENGKRVVPAGSGKFILGPG